jgi:hypothetical protein
MLLTSYRVHDRPPQYQIILGLGVELSGRAHAGILPKVPTVSEFRKQVLELRAITPATCRDSTQGSK